MKVRKIVIALLAAGIGAGAPLVHAADADRIAQLEKQLKMMQAQLEEMKKNSVKASEVAELRDQMSAQTKENVVVGDIPNSFRVPGSDVSIRVYGVAELNMVHETKGDNSNNDYSTFMPYMPLNGSRASERSGQTYLHARTSRIGIEGATPSPFGMIMAKVEGDFNNDPRTGNSAVYGDLKNIYTQQATTATASVCAMPMCRPRTGCSARPGRPSWTSTTRRKPSISTARSLDLHSSAADSLYPCDTAVRQFRRCGGKLGELRDGSDAVRNDRRFFQGPGSDPALG